MASPTRRRLAPAERMPQILDAALEEFVERGYAGASMAGTASRAGITKGLIYHYFPSKAELFKAVVRSCIQPVFHEAERFLAEFNGPRADLLRGLIEMAYGNAAQSRQQRVLFKLILAEADRFPELAKFYRTEVLSRALKLASAVVRSGVDAGEFRPPDGEEEGFAAVLVAPALMASIWQMILGEERAPALGPMREAHLYLALRALMRPGPGDHERSPAPPGPTPSPDTGTAARPRTPRSGRAR